MIATTQAKPRRPRPIGAAALAATLAAGGTIRRGTRLSGAFPAWEWQLFDSEGQFVAPVPWPMVQGRASDMKGVNR